jgi:hypothetical protein
MIAGALIRAGAVLDDEWALAHGLATLRWIRAGHPDPTALRHNPEGVGGLLDDQVQVAAACLEAFEVTGQGEWLAWSAAIMDRCWRGIDQGLHDTAPGAVRASHRLAHRRCLSSPGRHHYGSSPPMRRHGRPNGDAIVALRRCRPQLGVHVPRHRALSWAAA